MGRVEASSANWEELKPWKRDSRGFQVVADPCSTIAHWQEHHTGQDICTIWAKNQKLLKRALLLMGEESRCQAGALGRGRGRGGGRGWKATQRTFRTHPANPTWHTWGILHAARQVQVSCTFRMFCTWCKCSHTLPVQTSKIKIARSVGLT